MHGLIRHLRPLATSLAALILALGTSLPAHGQRLLVTSSNNNSVLAYDANTGAFLGTLVPNGSGGLSGPRILRRGPDGRLYVASINNHSVLRYEFQSGAFVDAFVPQGTGGIQNPWSLGWETGGALLVTSQGGPCALRFEESTGVYQGPAFCDPSMSVMQGLLVLPNTGHVLVSDFVTRQVREHDAAGAFVRSLTTSGAFSPRGLAVGPNGHLYVCSISDNRIAEFDLGSGAFVGNFVAPGSGGLNIPNDLAFRANGNLLVASTNSQSVLEYGPTGTFLRVLVAPGSGGLSGPCGLLLEGGASGGGRPDLADFGDAPDSIPACEGAPTCDSTASYPTLFGTANAAAGRTAPFHLPLPVANDCWFGGPRTNEPDAFQPCCDWVSAFHGGAEADADDGPVVLCLDPGCLSGVMVLADKTGRSAAIGCFGPMPPNPTDGFWIYRVGMGAATNPAVNRFINVAVDWDLSGHYGDRAIEWNVQDQAFPAAPGGTAIAFTNLFPILTVVPCGGPAGWCVGPFWTRFTVSPEAMAPSFPNGDWDGSSGAPDGYPWGETEDWVPYCDPQSSGGSCGSSGGFLDCNGNGRPDFVDVTFGYSSDFDQNEIPDECQYNDECSWPIHLCGYGPFPFDTRIATTGSQGQSNSLCYAFGTTAIANDVWYTWTAPATGTATLRTCGQTAVDTKVAVYAGAGCPAGDPLACVDDACLVQTSISWDVTQGAEYTIQLGDYPGAYPGLGSFRISLVESSFESFCSPGFGPTRTCPCSNPPAGPDQGCDNSQGTGGARLSGSGMASLAADTVVLATSGQRSTGFSAVLQGTSRNDAGFTFGKGVRCVTGTLKRLYYKTAIGGGIVAPQGGDLPISARSAALGNLISAGEHRTYTVYYRDPTPMPGCPATSTFDSTQALDVLWAP